MKELRPLTIISVGTTLLAVAVAAFCFAGPDLSRRMGLIESLLVGAAFGLVIFGPMAAAQAVRLRHPEWLIRHSFRIHWYTSIAMGLSLGYVIACLRHSTLDKWGLLALLTVFLGAVIKMALSSALPKGVTLAKERGGDPD